MDNIIFNDIGLDDAEVLYCKNFNSDLYEKIDEEVNWKQFPVRMYGKTILQPRETCYIADEKRPYRYSGFDRYPEEWTDTLTEIKEDLNVVINEIDEKHPQLNAVLCNKYNNGDQYIGPHSDDESDLYPGSYIASLSLGTPRDFVLQHKVNKRERKVIKLQPGSLILMGKNCQKNYKHSVPKRKGVHSPRINLTFRSVRPR